MRKLLYIGDSPTKQTGFGRVTENMIPALQKHFDVVLFGINYQKEKHKYPYRIIPAAGHNLEYAQTSLIGTEFISQVYVEERPDVIVMNNDVWVVADFYRVLKNQLLSDGVKFLAYSPIDGGPYHPKLAEPLRYLTAFATYTQFGKEVVVDAGIPASMVTVIPHGVNTKDFFPIDQHVARRELGIPENVFLFFNGNRNQPRKRYDIMIKGFAKFLELMHSKRSTRKSNVALFPHGGMKQRDGWNVPVLLERELYTRKLPKDRQYLYQYTSKPYPHNQVSIEQLNLIYNSCDIGMNTCYGEGWGLVNTEHAACKVLQMVPNHTSLGELFGRYSHDPYPDVDRGVLFPVESWITERGYLLERGLVSPDAVGALMKDCYDALNGKNEPLRKNIHKMVENAYSYFTSQELSWSHVSDTFAQWVRNNTDWKHGFRR
jgi:glycosyltransferase involved in cell wall biosynthesis